MSIPLLTLSSGIAILSYKTIISPLIKTISDTKSIVSNILTNKVNIGEQLKELGFVSKIEIISLFLFELENYDNDSDSGQKTHFMKTFNALITDITSTLEVMKNNLHSIENKITYHNSLYFSGWRLLDCEKEFTTLSKYKLILDDQYETLINILLIGKEKKTIITYVRN